MQQRLLRAGLTDRVHVDSCGTAAFNVGRCPDPRAVDAAARAGYDISGQVARQINDSDYQRFNYIIAMDRSNLSSISAWAPENFSGEIELFMHYITGAANRQIADPYYEGDGSFVSNPIVVATSAITSAL